MSRRLSNWLRSYAEFTQNTEAPDIFHFWTGVSTIAGALQRHVYIDQVTFKWTPNFYIIFVAPPGIATKSSSMGIGIGLLRKIDGVFMGPQSMTWQGLTFALQNSTEMFRIDRPTADFGSPEDILNARMVPQSAITCEVSELGTFLDPRDDALTSVLIDLWDGKEAPWERWLRSNDNTKIENPWINIIAGTTPSWLRTNFPESLIGGGLASRVVFVYADRKKQLIPYIKRVTDVSAHERLEDNLVHDLQRINELRGEYTLTEEALVFGDAWYRQHWDHPEQHLLSDRFQGYRARKAGHVHKLAIILSAAEGDSYLIEKHHLEMALSFITGVEYDMHKVFESVATAESSKNIYTLLNNLKIYGKLSKQDLWRLCMRSIGPKEFAESIDAAVAAGYLQIEATPKGPVFVYIGGENADSDAIKGVRNVYGTET